MYMGEESFFAFNLFGVASGYLRASEAICFFCFLGVAALYTPCMLCGGLPFNTICAYLSKK